MLMVQALALTYDDGPDGRYTPSLLDLLARGGAQATFFPIAPRAAEHPALIERMLADGHSVGLHCDRHVRHSGQDAGWCRRDTERALGRLRGLGVTPSVWRTPWGDTAPWTARIAADHGLRLVGWSVDTHDWRGDSATAMFAATRDSLTTGAIVLAHDGIGPGARRLNAEATLAYTEMAIGHARRHGLALRPLT